MNLFRFVSGWREGCACSQWGLRLGRLICASALAWGAGLLTGAALAGDEEQIEGLLDLLETETRLATRSGMNADFVPGMATILLGDEMLARGARTVWEALALVPGISPALEVTGERQVLSRGVGHGYGSGNIKILLDGVSMNSTLMATANPVLNIPLEQIERIEVIRGPGSSVHGEYAFAGVVNLITRTRDRALGVMAGEGAERGINGRWFWEDPTRDLAFSINLAGVEADGVEAWVERDALGPLALDGLSNAPGPANTALRHHALFSDLRWGASFAKLRLIDDATGDHFGINHFLPPDDGNLAARQRYLALQLGHRLTLTEEGEVELRAEAISHERDRDRLFVFPAGYLGEAAVFMDQDYRERRYELAADLHWYGVQGHALLLGLEAAHVEVDEARWTWSGYPLALDPDWLDDDRSRRILSALVQDQFNLGERVMLTATLRYDDYSDVGGLFSPRLAAVWRIDASNILKLQYARAFRPPTFYELDYARSPRLRAGEIASYEFGYIFKRPSWETRLILFHSDLTRPIQFDDRDLDGFINGPDAVLQGVELEYQHRFGAHFKVDANLSLVNARRRDGDEPLAGGADLLANLALLWRPRERWTAALQLRHVGARHRAEHDPRDAIDASTQIDLTLSYRQVGRGPFVHLGVKNLADAEVWYPDQLTSYDGIGLVYPDGYPTPGRRWWLSLGYTF
ncbi:TonB-dependent receptor plug domain-containing protein [Marichromatium bheemlicum]|uniref:TonB-dependent receptor n=1 Tax=Marichromatium bheemlicum TaxID=365339 RepID=A0ABX1I5B2_9GAMM|nr:TonB-dependent receptor [Marichromatium bheemlicum]NKN31871.1 TonB-dependent receptor [Marichromatium bheemlicum]